MASMALAEQPSSRSRTSRRRSRTTTSSSRTGRWSSLSSAGERPRRWRRRRLSASCSAARRRCGWARSQTSNPPVPARGRRCRVPPGVARAAADRPRGRADRARLGRHACGGHVLRAALFMTLSQVEAGVGCPLSMTHAAVPALRTTSALAAEWEPRLVSRSADGAWCGMSMTERQGGSDVRANLMRAEPAGDGEATLHGEKWFCSAPFSGRQNRTVSQPRCVPSRLRHRLRRDAI